MCVQRHRGRRRFLTRVSANAFTGEGRTTINIRRATAIAASATLALGLAACGGDSGNGGDAGDRPNQMYTWVSNQSDREQWETFIAGVQETEPEFNLTLDGPSCQEYWTLVKTRMSASDAPCIITTQAARPGTRQPAGSARRAGG